MPPHSPARGAGSVSDSSSEPATDVEDELPLRTGHRAPDEAVATGYAPSRPVDATELDIAPGAASEESRIVPGVVEACVGSVPLDGAERVEAAAVLPLLLDPTDRNVNRGLERGPERLEYRLATRSLSRVRTESVQDLDPVVGVDHRRVHARSKNVAPTFDRPGCRTCGRRGSCHPNESQADGQRLETSHGFEPPVPNVIRTISSLRQLAALQALPEQVTWAAPPSL